MTTMPGSNRVVLIEPWFSGSHRAWAEGWARASRYDVSIVSLPDGPWRWRLRAGARSLADKLVADIAACGPPEIVVVSGMVDVAQLLGFSRRSLPAETPVVVYQHESQLVYPTSSGVVDAESALRNWQSWCAVDLVLFNSRFHLHAVLDALPSFLEHQPKNDQLEFIDDVCSRFEVMPVGLELDWLDGEHAQGREPDHPDGPSILWPHRWEPDKDPAAFIAALRKLRASGGRARLILAGDDPIVPSAEKAELIADFADWVEVVGPFERDEYRRHLRRADIVVSCAEHEFFGVGVAEAIAAGARPVVPNALAYPDLIPSEWHESALYPPRTFGSALVDAVNAQQGVVAGSADSGLANSIRDRFGWSTVAATFDERLASLVASGF